MGGVNDGAGGRYFVKVRGRQLGPFGMERLRELVKQNQLSRVSQISTDGLTWFKASELAELFAPPRESEVGGSSSGSMGPKWYYSVSGAKNGPIDVTEIASLIQNSTIRGSDLAWRQGMSQWQQVSSIPELATFIPPPEGSVGFDLGSDPFAGSSSPFGESGHTLPNPYWQQAAQSQYPQPRRMTKSNPGSHFPSRGELEKNPDDGTTILILGIIGIFFAPCAFIAWGMGANYLTKCKEEDYQPGSGGKTGHILGLVFSILYLVSFVGGCCLYSGLFALALGANAAS